MPGNSGGDTAPIVRSGRVIGPNSRLIADLWKVFFCTIFIASVPGPITSASGSSTRGECDHPFKYLFVYHSFVYLFIYFVSLLLSAVSSFCRIFIHLLISRRVICPLQKNGPVSTDYSVSSYSYLTLSKFFTRNLVLPFRPFNDRHTPLTGLSNIDA